ncbi:hypothetical protein LC612_40870 [Nostoc sp. CHAB 5834]|nr:hypothetical protein [Nostoc sp. CHAB 5834]
MIIALAGRRIDEQNAEIARFPLANVDLVRERIEIMFKKTDCKILVCAGACGVDLLALSVAKKLGIYRYMVLPFDAKVFKNKSVVDRPGKWGPLFDEIYRELSSENAVRILSYSPHSEETFTLGNIAIFDQAELLSIQTAEPLSLSITAVIVWDGHSRGEGDVTEQFKKEAEARHFLVKELLTV